MTTTYLLFLVFRVGFAGCSILVREHFSFLRWLREDEGAAEATDNGSTRS